MNNNHENTQIVEANYISDYKIDLKFADNTVRRIDFGGFLKNHPHPQHNKYRNLQNFRSYKLSGGNIIWGKNWDLAFNPQKLYEGINPQ
jgi:hypothetical protein